MWIIFKYQKFSLIVLLSICLIFCQFQPGVTYKTAAYIKSGYFCCLKFPKNIFSRISSLPVTRVPKFLKSPLDKHISRNFCNPTKYIWLAYLSIEIFRTRIILSIITGQLHINFSKWHSKSCLENVKVIVA